MTAFLHLYPRPAPTLDEGDQAVRQPREHSCPCRNGCGRFTWQPSAECLVCKPFPMPLRPKASAA